MLKPLKSDLLRGVEHGFFTRLGGHSTGIYKGLNCGRGSEDEPANVRANRRAVATHFGGPEASLQSVHQIHSKDVMVVEVGSLDTPKADAMVTSTPGLVLGILTADCQPVLFFDAQAKVIGAAHAGSKGAKTGVLQNTITAMETLGADRCNICAAIGPSISQKAYEVGPDFVDDVCSNDTKALQFFAKGKGDRYQFDLPGYSLEILQATGIKQAEWTGHCTYSNPGKFYSYRHSMHKKEHDYGRLIACITL